MIPAIVIVVLATLWGVVEGIVINLRTLQNKPDLTTDQHIDLGAFRAVLVLFTAGVLSNVYDWEWWRAFLVFIPMGLLFIPVERIAKNLTRHAAFPAVKWYRMGEKGYDGFWRKVGRSELGAFLCATIAEAALGIFILTKTL